MSQVEFSNWQYPPPPSSTTPAAAFNNTSNTTNNIIITAQPGTDRTIPPPRNWTSDLCSCSDDLGICILSCCCPCFQEFLIAKDMGESSCNACCYVCSPASLLGLRTYMRGRENIRGSFSYDNAITFGCCRPCCYTCALAQLAREMKYVKTTRLIF
ncbi:hypothetical protein Btru_041865 [Bulinus truncatus]|nr:hypothetical protein Btru_041865 [Bulinus truncatus]